MSASPYRQDAAVARVRGMMARSSPHPAPPSTASEDHELWQELRRDHRRVRSLADSTFANCPDAETDVLRSVATAYVDYLLAWRASTLDFGAGNPPAGLSARPWRDMVASGDTIRRSVGARVDPLWTGDLEQEAIRLVTEVRAILRRLDPERSAARKARAALLAAWGRYDDHILALRQRAATTGDPPDLRHAGILRQELLREVRSAARLC